ncbi:MAG: hypothetical protein ACREX3_01765, partial [Gammaproteobacteria bacterium]
MRANLSISGFLGRVFGSRNERLLKRMAKTVTRVNELESSCAAMNNAQLAAKTQELRDRYGHGEALDDLLPEAFAAVREVGRRALDM